MSRGVLFPVLEGPELLVEDIRLFSRALRSYSHLPPIVSANLVNMVWCNSWIRFGLIRFHSP